MNRLRRWLRGPPPDAMAGRLFVPPGHFYSPIPDPAEAGARLARKMPDALPDITIDRAAMEHLWVNLTGHMAGCDFPERAAPAHRYYFENDFFSYADALVLHAMLRWLRPARVMEVGSGFSSAAMLDTRERHGAPGRLTCIDPAPERLRGLLRDGDASQCEVLARKVQDVDTGLFASLTRGDMLFIDSAHVLKTGNDLHHVLFEILPVLAPGVVVHFHDVFWPFEYPADWVLGEQRAWNEAYALRAFLAGNAMFEILFFNDYFARLQREAMLAAHPFIGRNTGGSLWLRKT